MKVFLNDFQGIMPKLNPWFLNQKIQNSKKKISKNSCYQILRQIKKLIARYEVKKLIVSGLAGVSAQNFERLIFKSHLAFPTGHTVQMESTWYWHLWVIFAKNVLIIIKSRKIEAKTVRWFYNYCTVCANCAVIEKLCIVFLENIWKVWTCSHFPK